ncbi:MAG: hypothetical protein ABFR50_12495, partial [Candidatus Fermentibacteria bacterium]
LIIDSGLRKDLFKPYKLGQSYDKKLLGEVNRFKDGDLERFLVPKEIADTMKQLSTKEAPKAIAMLNDVFRKSATSVYLPFTVTNAFRDGLMAYTTAPVFQAGRIDKFAKSWGKGFWEGAKHEFLGSSDLSKAYIKAGGGFGFHRGIGSTSPGGGGLDFHRGIRGRTLGAGGSLDPHGRIGSCDASR